jgi:hypothetical protein
MLETAAETRKRLARERGRSWGAGAREAREGEKEGGQGGSLMEGLRLLSVSKVLSMLCCGQAKGTHASERVGNGQWSREGGCCVTCIPLAALYFATS